MAFGLAAAITWGTGDFGGGFASRRAPGFTVVFGSQLVGATTMGGLALLRGEPFPVPGDVLLSVGAGLSGMMGLVMLYRALAVGQMGLAAPITAVLAAVIPVVASFAIEGIAPPARLLGLALGILAIFLVARPESGMRRPEGLGFALLAGVGFAGFSVLISQVQPTSLFWPLAIGRGAALVAVAGLVRLAGQPYRPPRAVAPLLVFVGLMEVGGSMFFLLSVQAGRLDAAAVLSALYPVTTIILARIVLHERLGRIHLAGVGLALGAIALIAMG